MTAWTALDPSQLVPTGLQTAVTALTDALAHTLSDAAAALALPAFPSLPTPPDVSAQVTAAILDTIRAVLAGGRLHALLVPVAKTLPPRRVAGLPPTLQDLQVSLDQVLGPADTTAAQAYADLTTRTGGNAGFYTAFADALLDVADPNRPQYDHQSDAVVAVVILAGSPRFSAVAAAASMFDQLTASKGDGGALARIVPTPQNLRARAVGAPSAANLGVRLDWDPPQDSYASPYFPGLALQVARYAVIRSTNPRALSARTVLDLFATQALTVGLVAGAHRVIAIGNGKTTAYLDVDVTLDPAVPAYYAVAWETTVTEQGADPTPLTFDRLSNVVKVDVAAPAPPAPTGRAPNWAATPSAIAAFPPLARTVERLLAETRFKLRPAQTATARLSTAMQLAAGASTRLAARATELLDDVQRLSANLARPMPSVYVTQLASASGGNAYLLAEIAKRLNDPTDASRPPFDAGEYVCGVCLVAGAARLADLAAVQAFFAALFGPATDANPLMGLLAAIDTAVTQAEASVFGPDLQPLPPGTTGIDPQTGRPVAPATPAIAVDGTPVATASPDNPAAGDTNVTPVSALC